PAASPGTAPAPECPGPPSRPPPPAAGRWTAAPPPASTARLHGGPRHRARTPAGSDRPRSGGFPAPGGGKTRRDGYGVGAWRETGDWRWKDSQRTPDPGRAWWRL